jgi:site-specific DNA recombinase
MRRKQREQRQRMRCAIYTRKSTEEGLNQEFNSLDAQREAGEAYIASMKHECWELIPERYDDGGFTGGNVERPALRRLLADIEAGKIDCVVVYKVDRLSRSLLDFARLMQLFDEQEASFVSVTQRFDTSNSMGRLTLNMLMSFAQFEREMISERTRDKIRATRRKGKWTGGTPQLGYDVVEKKLVVNDEEAKRVRQIFGLYLELVSLLEVVKELARRRWMTKPWTAKNGNCRGALPINKSRLHHLLTNVTYIGKIRYKDEVHEGEHEAVVDEEDFDRVQSMLRQNGHDGSAGKRNKHGALLRGLLRCAACGCGMSHAYTKRGNRLYRYYICNKAQQHGRTTCRAPSVPAGEIERFVVEEIKAIGRDPALVAATLAESRQLANEATKRLKAERAALERQRRADDGEIRRLTAAGAKNGELARLAECQERIDSADRRLAEIAREFTRLVNEDFAESDVAAALSEFDAAWAALKCSEQVEILNLLLERVDFHGDSGDVAITFHPTGLRAMATQVHQNEETAA